MFQVIYVKKSDLIYKNIFVKKSKIKKNAGEHVTKLVPKLSPVEECVDVPKVSTFSIQIIFLTFFLNQNE